MLDLGGRQFHVKQSGIKPRRSSRPRWSSCVPSRSLRNTIPQCHHDCENSLERQAPNVFEVIRATNRRHLIGSARLPIVHTLRQIGNGNSLNQVIPCRDSVVFCADRAQPRQSRKTFFILSSEWKCVSSCPFIFAAGHMIEAYLATGTLPRPPAYK